MASAPNPRVEGNGQAVSCKATTPSQSRCPAEAAKPACFTNIAAEGLVLLEQGL